MAKMYRPDMSRMSRCSQVLTAGLEPCDEVTGTVGGRECLGDSTRRGRRSGGTSHSTELDPSTYSALDLNFLLLTCLVP